MKELCKLLGIDQNYTTAYHPQTDRQTERLNQELENYLQIFINHRQDDWAEWLPLAEICHNNRIQASTRQTVRVQLLFSYFGYMYNNISIVSDCVASIVYLLLE